MDLFGLHEAYQTSTVKGCAGFSCPDKSETIYCNPAKNAVTFAVTGLFATLPFGSYCFLHGELLQWRDTKSKRM